MPKRKKQDRLCIDKGSLVLASSEPLSGSKITHSDNKFDTIKKQTVSVSEYRKLLRDIKSSDEQIKDRVNYLEAFCRNIIKIELNKYAQSLTKNR